MNKALWIVLLVAVSSCSRNKPNTSTAIDSESDKLKGFWLSDSYLNSVELSRSVYASKDYDSKFWGFVLDKNNLMSDSAILSGFTEHEGGYSCYLYYNTGKNNFEHDLSKDTEFSYLKGLPFELHLLDSNKLELKTKIQSETYRKVHDEQIALRDILFAGKYSDIRHDGAKIGFNKNGQVEGINDRLYFEIVFDFGEGIEYDACILYRNENSSRLWPDIDMYHFKINADTLNLYRLHTDWEEMNHKIGDLEYSLIRE